MKNPLYKLVFASLKKHLTQNIAAILMMSLTFCFVTAATHMMDSQFRLSKLEQHQQFSSAQAMLLDADPDTWQKMKIAFPLYISGEVLAAGAHDLGVAYNHMKITLGAMDDASLLMSGFTLKSGSWPKADDEIAISQASLMRLNAQVPLGESITLTLSPLGESNAAKQLTKTYRLSGVFLENTDEWSKRSYFFSSDLTAFSFTDPPFRTNIPTALVTPSASRTLSNTLGNGKTSYLIQFMGKNGSLASNMELITLNEQVCAPFFRNLLGMTDENIYPEDERFHQLPLFIRNNDSYEWFDRLATYNDQLQYLLVVLVFGALAVLLLGSGIASSFETRFNERRQQIGLIRAIGASRRQAIHLALMEALLLMVPSILLGLGMGSLIAKWGLNRLTEILGKPLTFMLADTTVMLFSICVCGILLCFFALRPMLRLTRKSPVALLHMNVLINSRKRLRSTKRIPKKPLRFLAGRYRRLHRVRHVFPIIVLSSCLAVMMLVTLFHSKNTARYANSPSVDNIYMEHQSKMYSWGYPDTDINLNILNAEPVETLSIAPDKVISQVQAIPGLISLSAAKRANNYFLFLQPHQVTEYIEKGDDWFGYESYQLNALDIRKGNAQKAGFPHDLYPWAPLGLGWPESGIQGVNDEYLIALEDSLMAGTIDLDAIKSGEAVLIGAASYYIQPLHDGRREIDLANQQTGEHVYDNNAFQVGDTITFGKVYVSEDNDNAKWKTVTKTARICGLVNKGPGTVFTSADQFTKWGFPEGVTFMELQLSIDENYDTAYRTLDMISNQYDFRLLSIYHDNQAFKRYEEGTVFLYQIIFTMLSIMGLALMISNTLSRLSIRQQELSLLRAVGMDGIKVKILLYGEAIRDGLLAAVWGTLLGIVACGTYSCIEALQMGMQELKLTIPYLLSYIKDVPYTLATGAFILFPMTGLAVSASWIQRLLNSSIVSGIRQVE